MLFLFSHFFVATMINPILTFSSPEVPNETHHKNDIKMRTTCYLIHGWKIHEILSSTLMQKSDKCHNAESSIGLSIWHSFLPLSPSRQNNQFCLASLDRSYLLNSRLRKIEEKKWPLEPGSFTSLMLSYEITEYFVKRSSS